MDLDPKMPVVNVGTRENPSYLPVEVCMVEPGQPAKAKLSPNQTRNMLNFAVRSPPQNAESIVSTGLRVLGLAPSNPTAVSSVHVVSCPDFPTSRKIAHWNRMSSAWE
jgi:hypothetical protein